MSPATESVTLSDWPLSAQLFPWRRMCTGTLLMQAATATGAVTQLGNSTHRSDAYPGCIRGVNNTLHGCPHTATLHTSRAARPGWQARASCRPGSTSNWCAQAASAWHLHVASYHHRPTCHSFLPTAADLRVHTSARAASPCRSAFRLRNSTSSTTAAAAALTADPDTGGWLGPGWDPQGRGTLDFYAPHGVSLSPC